jgi:hypothetical protein
MEGRSESGVQAFARFFGECFAGFCIGGGVVLLFTVPAW